MIEDSIWAKFDEEYRLAIEQAIMTLANSGILAMQVQVEIQRLVDGDPTQDVDVLAKEILRVRADTRGLQLLHDYGLQLTQEHQDKEN
jgi:hypothetical protein